MRAWVRGLAIVVSVVAILGAVGLLIKMAADYGGEALPTGSRSTVLTVDGSGPPEVVAGSARTWFDAPTAQALVDELAAALEGSDWCAGWAIVQKDEGQFRSLYDVGSDQGLDRSARECDNYVELAVTYHFTSTSAPLEDNAALRVLTSDLRLGNAYDLHPAYAISPTDLLHEDQGHNTDDILANAVAGLPLVLAEAGEIDPLTVAPVAGPADGETDSETESPADDGTVAFADAEGEGGSDIWRGSRTLLVLGLATGGLGLAVLLWAWAWLPLHRAGLTALVRPGGLAAQGRAVNPRRHLKAGLARTTASDASEVSEEDHSAAG